MRKRIFGLILPVALLGAMLMPGLVSAAPSFSVTIERDTCVAGAGKYGFGQGVLRVRIIEYGKSGANRFTFTGQVWHTWRMRREPSEDRWRIAAQIVDGFAQLNDNAATLFGAPAEGLRT